MKEYMIDTTEDDIASAAKLRRTFGDLFWRPRSLHPVNTPENPHLLDFPYSHTKHLLCFNIIHWLSLGTEVPNPQKMAASGAVKGGQDMVVSIRYRNDLPPPPMPPKLLDIDNGGLAQYLTTSFAAAMARREEPNIEADAEGGMPIDMIGIPGYFLGDESAIMAPEIQPVLDPADHALMLTPEQLRNQDSKSTNVSFLRRTQYMTSQNARANDPLVRPSSRALKSAVIPTSQREVLARDDKENIRRNLQKGFDLAYPESVPYNGDGVQSQAPTSAEKEAWQKPVHPENPNLKPVSFFPILPDFETLDDFSGLHYVKFDKAPLPALQGRRDGRIDVAMLNGQAITSLEAAYNAKKAAFDQHPELYEDPGPAPPQSWSLNIAQDPSKAAEVRKILDEADPDHDDPVLYADLSRPQTDQDNARLRLDFNRIRTYVNNEDKQTADQQIFGLSLCNPTSARNGAQKVNSTIGHVAHYYPIKSSLRLKSDRVKAGGGLKANQIDDADQNPFDVLSLFTREATAEEKIARLQMKGENDSSFRHAYAELLEAAAAEKAANEVQEIEEEQGALQGGEQDVTMDEVEHAEEMNVATNGMSREDTDRHDGEVAFVGNHD